MVHLTYARIVRERLTVLDELYAEISTTERATRPDEPPPEINDGYTKLLFAYGYHRLESATRAKEIEAAGRAQLEAHREDAGVSPRATTSWGYAG